MSEQNTVTIDDIEYVFEDLPEEIQNTLAEIQYTRDAMAKAQIEAQRAEMTQRGYIARLADLMSEYRSSNDQ